MPSFSESWSYSCTALGVWTRHPACQGHQVPSRRCLPPLIGPAQASFINHTPRTAFCNLLFEQSPHASSYFALQPIILDCTKRHGNTEPQNGASLHAAPPVNARFRESRESLPSYTCRHAQTCTSFRAQLIPSNFSNNFVSKYRKSRASDPKAFAPRKKPLRAHPAPNLPFPRPLQALSTPTRSMLSTLPARPCGHENELMSSSRNPKYLPTVATLDHQPRKMATAPTTLYGRRARSLRGSWTTTSAP